MVNIDKKRGFSLVEVLLILLFFSLMIAASMPMITRKHSPIPERISHGRFACYYDGDTLVQQLYSGKDLISETNPTACSFEPPAKTKYFYVQVVGGGGGGSYVSNYNKVTSDKTTSEYKINEWSELKSKITEIGGRFSVEDIFNNALGTNPPDVLVSVTSGSGTKADATNSATDGYTHTGEYMCLYKSPYGEDIVVCKNYRCDDAACSADTSNDPETRYKSELKINSVDFCANDKAGSGGTWYDTTPLKWDLSITTSTIETDPFESLLCSLGIVNGCRLASGTSRKVEYGTKSMIAYGGQGAVRGYTLSETEMSASDCYGGHKVCYTEFNASYPDSQDGYCEGRNGGACKTTKPSGTKNWEDYIFTVSEHKQKQVLAYGGGGNVGGYKAFVARNLEAGTVITPGKGGLAQTASTVGTDGGASCFGTVCVAGGTTLNQNFKTSEFVLDGTNPRTTISEADRLGKTSTYNEEIKFLLLNFLSEYKDLFKNFGKGGNGTSTRIIDKCTQGVTYSTLDITGLSSFTFYGFPSTPCAITNPWDTDHYTDAVYTDQAAQRGASGAIIISW